MDELNQSPTKSRLRGLKMRLSIYILLLLQRIYKQMNRKWIFYCTNLICQQQIENSMVKKNLWKKICKWKSKIYININQEYLD